MKRRTARHLRRQTMFVARRLSLALLLAQSATGSALAEDLCAKLDRLIVQSGEHFDGILREPGADGDPVTLVLEGASSCSVLRLRCRFCARAATDKLDDGHALLEIPRALGISMTSNLTWTCHLERSVAGMRFRSCEEGRGGEGGLWCRWPAGLLEVQP